MRRDCRHYYRRTAHGVEAVEGCSLGAAPDAPNDCPANCIYFEKRLLSTAGFVYGSLAPEVRDADEVAQEALEATPEAQATLAELEQLVDEIAPQVEAEVRESRRRDSGSGFWGRLFGRE
ncbi:MAG: hypothetical protein K1X95_03400 [Acidimicrobiia bacterium]|nr:hypothetical protein [Acidimicrobiia bacterium]